MPIYHCDPDAPNLKLDVSYEAINLNALLDEQRQPHLERSQTVEVEANGRRSRRVVVPRRLLVTATVCVASRDLYDFDVERLLRFALHGSEFIDQQDVPDVKVKKAPRTQLFQHCVYNVYYRFTKEALARAEEQTRLF